MEGLVFKHTLKYRAKRRRSLEKIVILEGKVGKCCLSHVAKNKTKNDVILIRNGQDPRFKNILKIKLKTRDNKKIYLSPGKMIVASIL